MMILFHKRSRAIKQFVDLSSSEDEIYTQNKTSQVVIAKMFPDNYDYKFIKYLSMTTQAHTTVLLDLSCNQRKMQGNGLSITMTKQRRLWFMNEARQCGKQVIKKLYLRCQHNQRQTGKHKKCN